MNIFILDEDPIQAARMQCDKHVVKMPLESAQMLSAAHRTIDYDTLPTDSKIYQVSHQHHPCTKWVMKSLANYMWLWNHFKALANEYEYRYYLEHKSWWTLRDVLSQPPKNIADIGLTPFAQAMPEQYKNDDAVVAYRDFYKSEKKKFLNYRKRTAPSWLDLELA